MATRDAVVGEAAGGGDAVHKIGSKIKAARLASGMSLRELARQLGVSPSFVSQLENDKSQPSVSTLYAVSQLLGLSLDGLFADDSVPPVVQAGEPSTVSEARRIDLGSPADAWPDDDGARISIAHPRGRSRLVLDSDVRWEQLASVADSGIDFIEIYYPPGSSSTNDGRMLRHGGHEYGYLLEGQLTVTFGFETYELRAGDSVGMQSSVPHLLTNNGTGPARGIWTVHHCAAKSRDEAQA